jgi:hypothetical protein
VIGAGGVANLFSSSVPGTSIEAEAVSERLEEAFRHWAETETYERGAPFLEFMRLTNQWKADTADESSPARIAMHPAYQQIIGMGPAALSWILADLQETHDAWFWALRAITREDPVPAEHRGVLDKMVRSWIRWGMQNGIV